MLDRAHRLRRSADFVRVRSTGRSWPHPLVVLQAAPADGVTRVGFVVSKRIGKAHDRNRAKRRLRAVSRHWLPRMCSGYSVVLIARIGVVTAPYPQIEEAVGQLLRRARLLIGPGTQ